MASEKTVALHIRWFEEIGQPYETSGDVEARYVDLVAAVRDDVEIPIAVKLGPSFTSLPNVILQLTRAGATDLVLFNRFLQPDIDLKTLRVAPNLVLSTSDGLRLPLRWIAILRRHLHNSLAATTGVHTSEDMAKLLLAGADVTMVVSALYRHGADHARTILDGLSDWMEGKGYRFVAQMKGSLSLAHAPDPAAFERANSIKALANFTGSEATP
jgi:dihydroorotate dehydrogenase (fumarate)